MGRPKSFTRLYMRYPRSLVRISAYHELFAPMFRLLIVGAQSWVRRAKTLSLRRLEWRQKWCREIVKHSPNLGRDSGMCCAVLSRERAEQKAGDLLHVSRLQSASRRARGSHAKATRTRRRQRVKGNQIFIEDEPGTLCAIRSLLPVDAERRQIEEKEVVIGAARHDP